MAISCNNNPNPVCSNDVRMHLVFLFSYLKHKTTSPTISHYIKFIFSLADGGYGPLRRPYNDCIARSQLLTVLPIKRAPHLRARVLRNLRWHSCPNVTILSFAICKKISL